MASKYHAKPTIVDGIRFASQAEARRYGHLKMLERAGTICDLELQPRFPLLVNAIKVCTYVADFRYRFPGVSVPVVEDVKGVQTPVYKLKKKMLLAQDGIIITEVRA
jgi:hypothetical protein|tara:strand:+ start:4177 stop:4497 length:321 start_codon:yes stop_codon:yes gene_type:complete